MALTLAIDAIFMAVAKKRIITIAVHLTFWIRRRTIRAGISANIVHTQITAGTAAHIRVGTILGFLTTHTGGRAGQTSAHIHFRIAVRCRPTTRIIGLVFAKMVPAPGHPVAIHIIGAVVIQTTGHRPAAVIVFITMWRIIGAGIALADAAIFFTNLLPVTVKPIVTIAVFCARILTALHTQGQRIIAAIAWLETRVTKTFTITQIANHGALTKSGLTIAGQITRAILRHFAGPNAHTLLAHFHRVTI
jgi:hypothetical protein